jgi:hypothetical protein
MDYMSHLPSSKNGNEFFFVVVDRFSKMVVLSPYKKSIIAQVTTKLFFERVWVHFGIPQTIISDQDSRFLSAFLSIWLMMDTKITKSTTFHPQTNGKIELVNMIFVHIMRMYNFKH